MSYNKSSSLQCTQIEKEGIYAYQFNGGQVKNFNYTNPWIKQEMILLGKEFSALLVEWGNWIGYEIAGK